MDDYEIRAICLDFALKTAGLIGTEEVIKSAKKYYDFTTNNEKQSKPSKRK